MNLQNIDYWRFDTNNMDKPFIHYKAVSEFVLPTCGSETIKVLAGAA